MKKVIYIISLIVMFGLISSACGNNKEDDKEKKDPDKVLVAYFSATGKTRKIASDISDVMNGTLHEIAPAELYSEKDLDWTDSTSRSFKEMHDANSRPAIVDSVSDLSSYNIVFIGFPIWWGEAPRVVNSFIEKNNLKDKILIVYATSGGSPVKPALDSLVKKYPELRWNQYPMLLNGASEAGLKKWKDGLGIE